MLVVTGIVSRKLPNCSTNRSRNVPILCNALQTTYTELERPSRPKTADQQVWLFGGLFTRRFYSDYYPFLAQQSATNKVNYHFVTGN